MMILKPKWQSLTIPACLCVLTLMAIPTHADNDDTVLTTIDRHSSHAQIVIELRQLKPLPKVHYSWPLPPELLSKTDASLLIEFVRLSHAASCAGEWVTKDQIDVLVRACHQVNKTKPPIKATIAINYSPWHRRFGKKLPPTDNGPTALEELNHFQSRMTLIKQWLSEANASLSTKVRISSMIFDTERFFIMPSDNAQAKDWNAAISSKYDLFYDASKRLFPNVRVEWYGRGIQRCAHKTGWAPFSWNTFDNKSDAFSCSLYRLPEIGYMRETYRRTVNLTKGVSIKEVTPWVALAAGYRRVPGKFQTWDQDWDYDPIYSHMMGAEINQAWYGRHADRFAPWLAAKVVIFYPAPFNANSPAWAKHFIAYVKGATP